MEAEQETREDMHNGEETYQENPQPVQELTEERIEGVKSNYLTLNNQDRSNFIHGLAVGLGLGCIATFVIVWISVFFTPRLPGTVTYENLLAIFIYPLIYLLAVGLIALTAGIVREYYSRRF